MNQPLVSIAIPCYNCSRFVENAVRSVINQTYQNWELLIIDDGSKDNTVEIIRKIKDSRITIFSDGCNKGLPARLNESIKWARGEYYARMDADDIMHKDRIAKQVAFLMEHPNVDVLGCSAYIINGSNSVLRKRIVKNDQRGFIHPTVIAKTSWFNNNQYNEAMKRSQDIELWLRTKNKSCFANMSDCLFFYREEGVPQVKKYVQTQLLHIKHFYKFGNSYGFSMSQVLKNRLLAYVKIVVFSIVNFIGLGDVLLRMRSSEQLDTKEIESAERDLKDSIV